VISSRKQTGRLDRRLSFTADLYYGGKDQNVCQKGPLITRLSKEKVLLYANISIVSTGSFQVENCSSEAEVAVMVILIEYISVLERRPEIMKDVCAGMTEATVIEHM
jgi:hypothetical protein